MNSKQQQLKKAERAWHGAKARAEQAVDRLSDCERKVARLTEELNCADALSHTPTGPNRQNTENSSNRRLKKTAKKLKGILIEVNGGVVSHVQFDGKPVAAYHLFDWDELLGDGDTRKAWEGLSQEEQQFLRNRYPVEYKAIQQRLEEEATDNS